MDIDVIADQIEALTLAETNHLVKALRNRQLAVTVQCMGPVGARKPKLENPAAVLALAAEEEERVRAASVEYSKWS